MLKDIFRRKNAIPEYTEPFLVRIDFGPDISSEVREVLESLDNLDDLHSMLSGKTPLFLTFRQVEEIFTKLRDLAGKVSMIIDFKEVSIWKYDVDSKWKPASPGEVDGNPYEYITLPGFEIDYRYKNLTKPLFEIIFNLPENADIEYDDKLNICEELKHEYIASTNINENYVAQLPTREMVDKGKVNLLIPAFEAADLEKQAVESSNNRSINKNPVYVPEVGKFIEEKSDKQVTNNDHVVIKNDTNNRQTMENADKRPEISNPKPLKRSSKRRFEDDVKQIVEISREKGHVEIPQLDVEVIDPVEPGNKQYVAYMLNQKKKTINQQLLLAGRKANDANEKALIKKRNEYQDVIMKTLADFRKNHANYSQEIQLEIKAQLEREKEKLLNSEKEKIDQQRDRNLERVKQNYEVACQEFRDEAEDKKKDVATKVEKKYNSLFEEKYRTALQERKTSLLKEEADNKKALMKKYEIEINQNASELREASQAMLEKLMKAANETLVVTEKQALADYLNAKQTLIAEKRAETERERISAPNKELREVSLDLSQVKEQLASATATRDALEKDNADLKQRLAAKQRENELLRTENSSLSKEKIANNVTQSDNSANDMIKQFIQLQIAQQLGQQKIPEKAERKEYDKKSVNDEQLKTVLKGTKRMVAVLSSMILLGIGGGGYYVYHQHITNQAQVNKLTKQVETANQKVLEAQSNSKEESQEEIDKKATTALHSNDQKELNKYPTEKYYQLDKAIIANDPEQVKQAINALGDNLKFNDRYRMTQALSLLEQGNDKELATKVQAANK
ncbi:hypothetical protein AB9M75_06060 [Lactobacillus sp. AN1001]